MSTAAFKGWKGYTQRIRNHRWREEFKTAVEDLTLENSQCHKDTQDILQKIKFLTDSDAKDNATKLIGMMGHRSLKMWLLMWRRHTVDSIFDRRDRVKLEWEAKLAQMTAERDRMLWRMEHCQTLKSQYKGRIAELGENERERQEVVPVIGEGLMVALHTLESQAFKYRLRQINIEIVFAKILK